MTCGIYKIVNNINGKIYIGQSIDIERRWNAHIFKSKKIKRPLYSSFKKYGIDNFTFSIICEVPESALDVYEISYIKYYDSTNNTKGYNLTTGGNGAKGFKHTEETKKLISQCNKGRIYSKERNDKLSEVKKHQSEHTRKLNSLSKLGIKNPMHGKTGDKHHGSKEIIDDKGNHYPCRRALVTALGICQPTCSDRLKKGIYYYAKKN